MLMINVDELPKRRSSWIRIANIPRARLGWEFSDCTEVTKNDVELIKRWVAKVKDGDVIRADGNPLCGKGLLIVGEPGHGKTTLALTIVQEMLKTFAVEDFSVEENRVLVKPCYFATFNDIINLKGSQIGNDITDEQERLLLGMHGECADDAYNIRVLVIDDIGKEHTSASGWQRSLLHHILRTRFNNGLPTIVTTNLPVKSWETAYGDATGSFIHEAFATIELESIRGDLRK
jgi:DNA replication protein DnaC